LKIAEVGERRQRLRDHRRSGPEVVRKQPCPSGGKMSLLPMP
jgi:hypothetical protein